MGKLSYVIDLFAKASEGRSSGDSPVTVGKVLGTINGASKVFTEAEECVSITSNISKVPETDNTQDIDDEISSPSIPAMIMDLSSDELLGSTSFETTTATTTKVTAKRVRPNRAKGAKGAKTDPAKKAKVAISTDEVVADVQAIGVVATPQKKGTLEGEEENELSSAIFATAVIPPTSPAPADVTAIVTTLPFSANISSDENPKVAETETDNIVEEAINPIKHEKRKRRSCNILTSSNGIKDTLRVSPAPESEVLCPEIALKVQCHQERLKVVLAELVALET